MVQITWLKLLSALYFNGAKYCKHHQTNKQTNQTVFLGVLGATALRQIVTNELSYHYLFQAGITSLLKLILYIYNTFHQTKIRAPSQLHWDLVTWLPEKRLDARKWSQTSCRRMNCLCGMVDLRAPGSRISRRNNPEVGTNPESLKQQSVVLPLHYGATIECLGLDFWQNRKCELLLLHFPAKFLEVFIVANFGNNPGGLL